MDDFAQAVSGGIFVTAEVRAATGSSRVKVLDAVKHLKMHRAVPHNQDAPSPNGDSAEVEKPWFDIYPTCHLCLRNSRRTRA